MDLSSIVAGGSGKFEPPVSIVLDHLCMLHQEVVRLDREVFGATSPAKRTAPLDCHVPETAPANSLKMVGKTTPIQRDSTLYEVIAALLALFPPGKEPSAKDLEKAGTIRWYRG